MAIRSLQQITCSLNLGLIYSFDYSWSPQGGSEISVYFVKQDGNYTRPQYLQNAYITIGTTSFSMVVVASNIELASGRRVMQVTFVDQSYKLDNYQVVLTGKGCGYNVYQLGRPVDNRTPAQKQATAIDSTAQQIAEFTQFPDVEYTFNDFLAVLRQRFNVQVLTSYNVTLTAPYMGTFREVLNSWCSMFNLSWFFENGIIKIFNPVTLSIALPAQPADAISYSSSEDVRDTYGKTVYNWFQQEGGQFDLNQTSDDNGALLVRTDTLFPIGYEQGLSQTSIDLNQVAAAQYGREFWILYNYSKGTLSSIGWTPQSSVANVSVYQTASQLGATIAAVNQTELNARYEAYRQYGEQIAGRWYLSTQKSELATYENYQWFDETSGQIFTFTNVDDKSISLSFLTPTNTSPNIIPETAINSYYPGINYVGNRMAYRDDYTRTLSMTLTEEQQNAVSSLYASFVLDGSEGADYGQLNPNSYIMYASVSVAAIQSLFDQIPTVAQQFAPRFTSVPIKGITRSDYSTLKATQTEQPGIEIINGNQGGNVVSNTSVIKTLEQGSYRVYYDKYSQCASAYSAGNYFGHEFIPRQISSDNQIGITFSKTSSNVYRLNRDYSVINQLVNNPILPQLAQPRSFLTRRVSYTLNYFANVPLNFLTNGLVGMSISIDDNGVTASYSFSNEVLAVPNPENRFAEFEQQIRNSWIRQYRPTQTIT